MRQVDERQVSSFGPPSHVSMDVPVPSSPSSAKMPSSTSSRMTSSADGALVVFTFAFETLAWVGAVGVVRYRLAATGVEACDREAEAAGAAMARKSETDRRAGFILSIFTLLANRRNGAWMLRRWGTSASVAFLYLRQD